MNLLLVIKHPGDHFSRVIVKDKDSVLSSISSTLDNRLRLCENISALNKIERILSGKVVPYTVYLAGNSFFGKILFKYTRPNKSPEKTYDLLSVMVFSALGSTLEEHDERYKRLKAIRYQALAENKK